MALSTHDGPIKLRIPDACMFCAGVGRVILEPTILSGDALLLHWRCRRCNQSWPVTLHELTVEERREGAEDRRQSSRSDRRKR